MKEFKDFIYEKVTKEDVQEELECLAEIAETDLELTLIDLLNTMVVEEAIKDDVYGSIFDLSSCLDQEEVSEHDILNVTDDELGEAVAAFKKKGFVRCPSGLIRKRGNCGKKLDLAKSKSLKKMRKTGAGKQAFKKAGIRATKTKRRTGQL